MNYSEGVREWVGLSPAAILMIIVACTALGLAYGALRPRYHAAASIDVLGDTSPTERRTVSLSHTDMKRFWSAYANAPALESYLALSKSDPGDTSSFLVAANGDAYWKQWIRPVYPLVRADSKEFGDLKLEREQVTMLLALDLRVDASSEETAVNKVKVLRDYVVDALVDNSLKDWALNGRWTFESRSSELESKKIIANRRLDEMTIHASDLNAILKRYPDTARLESRQVVSVNSADGSDRYLSPVAQLVAVESSMSNQRVLIGNIERELFQAEMYRGFYSRAASLYEKAYLGRDRLKALEAVAAEIIAGGKESDARAREVHIKIMSTLLAYRGLTERLNAQTGTWVTRDRLRNPVAAGALGALGGIAVVIGYMLLYRSMVLRRTSADGHILGDSR